MGDDFFEKVNFSVGLSEKRENRKKSDIFLQWSESFDVFTVWTPELVT